MEAQGLITQRRMISILPNKVERLQVELYPEPQTGRLQAISYATVGGGLSLAALAAFGDNSIATGISLVAGAAAGFVTSTYAMPRDIPLGTSSLAITTSVFGAVVGAATATLFTDKTERVAPFGGIGALAGGALGYITGLRTRVRPGEAAVINSALLWGTTAGGLFALSFNAPDARTSGGLVLGGLSMGAVGGLLVTRYFTISRVHAALVDVGGVIGAIGGVALEGILYPPKNGQTARDLDATTRGRIANFALGGMALGLITAGILTRDFDAPALALTPSIGHAIALDGRTMTTFGVAARW